MAESTTVCKAVLEICANCCKGPDQLGLRSSLHVDGSSLKVCAACHSAYFCSRECQEAAWYVHKKSCNKFKEEGLIACVMMTKPLDFKQVFLKPDDPIFESCTQSPPMGLCGIPLCLKQMNQGTNNQWCTYLMIEPVSGMAPYPWSECGKVLIVRKDRMPVTPEHIYQLGDFISDIIQEFGNEDETNIYKRSMTKEAFLTFLASCLGPHGRKNKLGVAW